MLWECPGVNHFWKQVARILSNVMGVVIPCLPNVFLFNDDSALALSKHQKKNLFCGLTAAKEMVVMR